MKNYKKVLDDLKQVSPNFYVGGSLSLYVFHYITRTPKDLDIQSTDPIFLKAAKEMQEMYPVPEDGRGGWRLHPLEERLFDPYRGSYSVDDPPEMISYIINSDAKWEAWAKEELKGIKKKNQFLARRRNPFKVYAAFILHGTRVEVYANEVTQSHNIHDFQFVDPNEVLYYKEVPEGRRKDEEDLAECYAAFYPERIAKHGMDTSPFLGRFRTKNGVIENDLPRHIIEQVVQGKLKPRSLAGHDNAAKKARKKRITFLEQFKLSKAPWVDPEPNRHLSNQPKRLKKNAFKLWGVSSNWPNVKLYPKSVLITDEYLRKVRISKEEFGLLCQIHSSDELIEGLQESAGGRIFKIGNSKSKPPVVRFNPTSVTITSQQGKVFLEHKAFKMLKTIHYGMIA